MKMHLEIVLLHSTLKRDFLQVKNDLLKYVIYLVHKPLKSGGGGGSSSTAEMPIRGCQIGGPLLRPKRGHCGIFFCLQVVLDNVQWRKLHSCFLLQVIWPDNRDEVGGSFIA